MEPDYQAVAEQRVEEFLDWINTCRGNLEAATPNPAFNALDRYAAEQVKEALSASLGMTEDFFRAQWAGDRPIVNRYLQSAKAVAKWRSQPIPPLPSAQDAAAAGAPSNDAATP